MDDQTRAVNANAILTGQDAGQEATPSGQSSAGGGGNPPAGDDSNATLWQELSPVLAPIPFAIVIFLFSLLANARGLYNITPLPLGLILLALVVIQGTCLYYAGNRQTPWMLSLIGGYVAFVLVGAYVFFGLGGSLFTLVLLVILGLLFARRFTRQVPVGYVDVVVTPRGRSHTLTPGFNLIYPWEKVLVRLPTKEIRWRTTPPVHITISRDQEADIVADITYQLAEDVADIAVLHMANWEEDLHQYFLGDLRSIVNDIPPDEILSWAHHIHDHSPVSDDPANPVVETRWDRLNKKLLWHLQSEMAQRGIQVNMVHVQDITVLSQYYFANSQTRPMMDTGKVRGQQPQQAWQPQQPGQFSIPSSPPPPSQPQPPQQPPTETFKAPPAAAAQAQQEQTTQSPRIVLPPPGANVSAPLRPGVIQGMIDSYKAVNEQLINDPNFIMELAARFKAVADNPEANAYFPVDAEKAAYNLIRRANLILEAEEHHHHSGPTPAPATVERRPHRAPNPPNDNLAYGG